MVKKHTAKDISYFNQYSSEHYKQFNIKIAPEIFNKINSYCEKNKISRAEFVRMACKVLIGE